MAEIEPLSDLPPSIPTKRICNQIEQRAKTQADEIMEFDLPDKHLNKPYSIKVIILPKFLNSSESSGVGWHGIRCIPRYHWREDS